MLSTLIYPFVGLALRKGSTSRTEARLRPPPDDRLASADRARRHRSAVV